MYQEVHKQEIGKTNDCNSNFTENRARDAHGGDKREREDKAKYSSSYMVSVEDGSLSSSLIVSGEECAWQKEN